MTIKKSQLRAFGEAIKATQPQKKKGYFAILGTLTGQVLTGVSNLVYITTFEGQTLTVINRRVPNYPGSVVFVGSDDYSANRIEILYTLNVEGGTNDGSSAGSNIGAVPPHSHSADSLDPTWVYESQFTPLLVLPISGTLTVQVYPGAIRKTNSAGWKYIADQVLDLSGDMPASGACWALLQANDDGSVDAVIGATQADRASLTEADIPEATTGKGIVAVVLEAGYTELYRNSTRNDFLDLRFDKLGGEGGDCLDAIDLDAGDIAYAPLDLNDWDGLTDPGSVGDALDQLADRSAWLESEITPLELSDADISNPPTEAQLITAFGSPDLLAGKKGYLLDDNGSQNNAYLALAIGGHWWLTPLTRAVLATPSVTVDSTATLRTASGEWYGRASLEQLPDGIWVLAYYHASAHAANDGELHIKFSDDYGATWSDEDRYFDGLAITGFPMNPPGSTGSRDAGEPWLMTAPNGDLLIHMWLVDYGAYNGGSFQARSTDGGKTWSAPAAIDFLGTTSDADIFSTEDHFVYNGVIYAAAKQYQNVTPSSSKDILVYSNDNGATWNYLSDMSDFSTYPTYEVAMEYIGNDTIVAIFRDFNFLKTYKRISNDLGATWGSMTDITSAFGNAIVGRARMHTRSHWKVYDEWWKDKVLIVFGMEQMMPGSSTSRRNAVWISQDAGVTWSGPFYTDTTSEDGGYGDALWNPDTNQWVYISYRGTLAAADLKQYNLTIGGI